MHAGKRPAGTISSVLLVSCPMQPHFCCLAVQCSSTHACRWSVHELNWAWILLRFLAFNPLMTNSENIAAGESEAYAAYSVLLCVWCRSSICIGAWHLDCRPSSSILAVLCHIIFVYIYIVSVFEWRGSGTLIAAYCVFFVTSSQYNWMQNSVTGASIFFLLFCVFFLSLILDCTF